MIDGFIQKYLMNGGQNNVNEMISELRSMSDEEQIDLLCSIIAHLKDNYTHDNVYLIDELYQRIIRIKDKIIGEIIEESQFSDRDD